MKYLLLLCLFLTSCSALPSKGGAISHSDKITTTTTDPVSGAVVVKTQEKKIEVKQPDNPASAASVQTPEMKSSTGTSQARDFLTEGIADKTTWAGIALIVLGIGIMIFGGYIPFLSAVDGIWIALAGVGIIFVPIFLDRYAIWILLAGILGVAAWLIFKQKKIAYFEQATGPEVQAKLLAEGDNRAAGALAFVSGDKIKAKAMAKSFK